MTFQQALALHFEEAMEPVRTLDWWVAFDYQPAGRSSIYANHIGFLSRKYTELLYRETPPLEVYIRWFASCAALLTQVANDAVATRLVDSILLSESLLKTRL